MKGRPNKYNHDKIIALRLAGQTRAEIARQQGCSLTAVSNVLARHGLVGLGLGSHQRKDIDAVMAMVASFADTRGNDAQQDDDGCHHNQDETK